VRGESRKAHEPHDTRWWTGQSPHGPAAKKQSPLKAGKYVAGPSAWKGTREGYSFFQGPPETALIQSGARLSLRGEADDGQPRGVAPMEGSEGR